MTPSEHAKSLGLNSLAEVCSMTKQSPQTLSNWAASKPELFRIVVIGCAVKKQGQFIRNASKIIDEY